VPHRPVLSNADARKLFLHRHLLGEAPQGPGRGDDLLNLIRALGFVQVDSVNTVERAHHMILFARRPAYRPAYLKPLLERDRSLFEHWTHDAAVIPTEFFPHWRLRFDRDDRRLHARWSEWQGTDYVDELERVIEHIRANGPCLSSDLLGEEGRGGPSGGWWNWHPSKTALEYNWRTGRLAVARREGFQKIYDLTERVLPEAAARPRPPLAETVDFLNWGAMERLGFATSGHVAAFWAHLSPAETAQWCRDQVAAGELIDIRVENARGMPRPFLAPPGIFDEVTELAPPPNRLRILSPFDPLIRDRNRTELLFGFHYRIEIFVPESRRRYGYYVFPMLEGDRLIGRIDMRAERDAGILRVAKLWLEDGVRFSKGRMQRLDQELARMARFAGLASVAHADGWLDEVA